MAVISVYVVGAPQSGKKNLITTLLKSQDNSFEYSNIEQNITLQYNSEHDFVFRYYEKASRTDRCQYPKSDIILITLDPTNQDSIDQCEQWLAEAKAYMSHETTNYILVVTKSYLKAGGRLITNDDIQQIAIQLKPKLPVMYSEETDYLLSTMFEMVIPQSPSYQVVSVNMTSLQNDKIMLILQERFNNLFQKVKPKAEVLEQTLSQCLMSHKPTKLSRLRAMQLIVGEAAKQYHQNNPIDIDQIISAAYGALVNDDDKTAFKLSTHKKSSGLLPKCSQFECMAKKIRKLQ